jgi:hypothetical protein
LPSFTAFGRFIARSATAEYHYYLTEHWHMADVTIVATEGIRVQHYGNGISCFTTTTIAVAISVVAK